MQIKFEVYYTAEVISDKSSRVQLRDMNYKNTGQIQLMFDDALYVIDRALSDLKLTFKDDQRNSSISTIDHGFKFILLYQVETEDRVPILRLRDQLASEIGSYGHIYLEEVSRVNGNNYSEAIEATFGKIVIS